MPKLIIIDDEPFTVDMLQTFLQINGYETVSAYTGEDGLVLTKVEQPEIMILDLMLPDIEGYEVCRRLRAYPDSAHIPVLILSARGESSSKERAMAAGADVYMTKPVKFPDLLAAIKQLVETGHPAANAAASATPPPATSSTPIATATDLQSQPVVVTPTSVTEPASPTVSKLTEIARTPLEDEKKPDASTANTANTPKHEEVPNNKPSDKQS